MDRLISLQAAIDAIKKIPIYVTLDFGETCGKMPVVSPEATLYAIQSLPSAQPDLQECEKCIFKPFKQFQPEPQWTPCSERMPERYDWFLVSNKETSWVALWKDGVFLSVSGYFEFSDIIAWMPLPEPYNPT